MPETPDPQDRGLGWIRAGRLGREAGFEFTPDHRFDEGVRRFRRRFRVSHDTPIAHDGDRIGKFENLVQEVRDEQNCDLSVAQSADEAVQLASLLR